MIIRDLIGRRPEDAVALLARGRPSLSYGALERSHRRYARRHGTRPGSPNVVRSMMIEAADVAAKLSISFPVAVDDRIEMAATVGEHRTSMLQDAEAERPTELDALWVR